MEIGSAYLTDFHVSFILVILVIRGRGRELRIENWLPHGELRIF